ncbi:MAG: hypothetical protein J6V44_04365 [Methanobrevibacter sp.]|nr:hypothetical protein [Methanobrevibacter sp.]
MRGLSINKFWNMRPKLPFRFVAKFFTGLPGVDDDKLSYCVTNVSVPKMEGQASEGSMYLGNTIFTIPVWNIASRKLDISFEETDTMEITQFVDKLNSESYGKVPWRITVVITEFEEHNRYDKSKSTAYICHLVSYDEPQFKRDGAAGQVTMSTSFIVDSIVEDWSESMGTITGQRNVKQTSDFNPNLDTMEQNVQNTEFTYGNVNFGVDYSIIPNSNNKLTQFTSDNKNREANYDALLDRMRTAGINTNDTTQVVKYLQKEGYITDSYQKGINGLCATSTYLVAAITTGQKDLGAVAGNGENQDLSRYGYKKVQGLSGNGSADLNKMVKNGDLKVGDVINITYADGSKYGHAVTVIQNPDGSIGFASDFKQKNASGQANEARVGSFYVQRRG